VDEFRAARFSSGLAQRKGRVMANKVQKTAEAVMNALIGEAERNRTCGWVG
jgi:hypothetical protein